LNSADGTFIAHNLCKYSAIDVGKTDKLGNKVYYSLVDTTTTASGDEFKVLFYNGRWKKYPIIFSSSGGQY